MVEINDIHNDINGFRPDLNDLAVKVLNLYCIVKYFQLEDSSMYYYKV